MPIQATTHLLSPLLMDEKNRINRHRSVFYSESQLPSETSYDTAEKIARSSTQEWFGISASQQFSAQEIHTWINQCPNKKFTVVDLREETHLFLNGYPVSETNAENNLNAGKTLSEIQQEESDLTQTKLVRLQSREKIETFVDGVKNKVVTFTSHPKATSVEKACTEETLIHSLKREYVRIPITDHGSPSTSLEHMNELVALYEKQKEEGSWVHFHCAAGRGRSSVALSIFAILEWSKTLSLEEIFSRLESRGNVPLRGDKIDRKRSDPTFWNQFYQFSLERESGMKWADWKKQASASSTDTIQ